MDIGFRSRLTTGFAAVSVGALVLSPVTPGEAPTGYSWSAAPAVMLTAATQTLPTTNVGSQPVTAVVIQQPAISPLNPVTPLIQQVSFHVAFLSNFVSTGAVLFGHEFAIPGALLQNIHNGTSVPGALSQALQSFAQIELQAGRDLVGFAAQYVSFQLNFVASLPGMVTMSLAKSLAKSLAAMTPKQATVELSDVATTPRIKTVKSAVSVGSTNHPRSDVTHNSTAASTTTSTTVSTTASTKKGDGTRHQPRRDHNDHPKSGGGRGN